MLMCPSCARTVARDCRRCRRSHTIIRHHQYISTFHTQHVWRRRNVVWKVERTVDVVEGARSELLAVEVHAPDAVVDLDLFHGLHRAAQVPHLDRVVAQRSSCGSAPPPAPSDGQWSPHTHTRTHAHTHTSTQARMYRSAGCSPGTRGCVSGHCVCVRLRSRATTCSPAGPRL
jgi:hypothetical protein